MEYKIVPLGSLKASPTGRQFSGYASTFGNLDLAGDIVVPGAFDASLKRRPRVPILWQHSVEQPIGATTQMHEDSHGLHITAKLSPTSLGADVAALLKDGAVNAMSIGYNPVLTDYTKTPDGKTARLLKQLDLMEVSLVSFPANEDAKVLDVKSRGALALARRRDPLLDYIRREQAQVRSMLADAELSDALLLYQVAEDERRVLRLVDRAGLR